MPDEKIILHAKFDEKLKTYWFLNAIIIMLFSFIGVPLIPFWLLGLGQYLCRRRYENTKAELTERSLHLRSGYLVRVEKHVPLDKIQDLALREGPVLRALGLSAIGVETAGSSGQGGPDAALVGLVDAVAFRDAVLEQRERMVRGEPGAAAPQASAPAGDETAALLLEIRDALLRIEQRLAKDS